MSNIRDRIRGNQQTDIIQATNPFNKLLNAEKADEIVPALIKCCWEALGNDGEPPPLTSIGYALPSKLDHHGSIRSALDSNLNCWQSEVYFFLFECFRAIGLDVRKATITKWEQIDVREGDSPEIYDEKMQKLDEAVYFVFDQETLLFNENPSWIASILEVNNFLAMDSDKIYNQHRELIPFGYSEKQRQCANFDRLYFDLSSLIHYITQHHTMYSRTKKIDPQTVIPIYLQIMTEKIEFIHSFWKFCWQIDKSLKNPLASITKAWILDQTHCNINTATVSHVNQLLRNPYTISEINRRQWEVVGSVDAIEVDGEPIVTKIPQKGNIYLERPAKVLKPKGVEGPLKLVLPRGRNTIKTPIILIAYGPFGKDLRSALPSDIAQLLTIMYTTNEPLKLTSQTGAQLLTRSRDGSIRPPHTNDFQRFEDAFACIHGLGGWITDENGIHKFYPFSECQRLTDEWVSLDAPAWARDKKQGRWTLTAGFGTVGQNRFKPGQAHTNNIWRVIHGVEYWLARDPYIIDGEYQGISQKLIPESGTTGPGPWDKLTWQQFMTIAGDVWNEKDEVSNNRAYKRFQKIRDTLTNAGYEIKKLNETAPAEDTVEFLFFRERGRNGGKVWVRATQRFVEGARKAQNKEWLTVSLSEFLGLKG